MLRLARRGVGGDREHRGNAPRRHVDDAHVRVGSRLRSEEVRDVGLAAVAQRDGARVRPCELHPRDDRQAGVEDDERARALACDQHAVAGGCDGDAVGTAARAEVRLDPVPEVGLVETRHRVVGLNGREDVSRSVERQRARISADGHLVRQRPHAARVERDPGDGARVGVHHEDGTVRCDSEGARPRRGSDRRARDGDDAGEQRGAEHARLYPPPDRGCERLRGETEADWHRDAALDGHAIAPRRHEPPALAHRRQGGFVERRVSRRSGNAYVGRMTVGRDEHVEQHDTFHAETPRDDRIGWERIRTVCRAFSCGAVAAGSAAEAVAPALDAGALPTTERGGDIRRRATRFTAARRRMRRAPVRCRRRQRRNDGRRCRRHGFRCHSGLGCRRRATAVAASSRDERHRERDQRRREGRRAEPHGKKDRDAVDHRRGGERRPQANARYFLRGVRSRSGGGDSGSFHRM